MTTWVLVAAMQIVVTSHPPLPPEEAVRVLRASRSTADRTDAPPPLPDGPTVTFIRGNVADGPFGSFPTYRVRSAPSVFTFRLPRWRDHDRRDLRSQKHRPKRRR